MDEEIDLLHPLATLDWTECGTISAEQMTEVQSVVLNDKLYVAERGPISIVTTLFVSSDLVSWTALETPTKLYGLSVYHSKLVLVGGIETSTEQTTNKIWTSDNGMNWRTSLPPMTAARLFPSVVNAGSPEWLVVVDGSIEVLKDGQWLIVYPAIPSHIIVSSTVHDGKLYIATKDYDLSGVSYDVIAYDLHSLVTPIRGSVISSLKLSTQSIISNMVSFRQNLLICSGDLSYVDKSQLFTLGSSLSLSHMLHCGYIPTGVSWPNLCVHPSGDLIVLARRASFFCVFRGTLRVSIPYNIEGRFTVSSLYKLEKEGVKIISVLKQCPLEILAKIIKLQDVDTTDDLESLLNKWTCTRGYRSLMWTDGEGHYPNTWRGLFEVLSTISISAKHLCQQISSYLKGLSTRQEFLNAYRQVLASQDSIEMWFFKVILIGAPRLGKTTFCRRLKGEIDDIHSSGESEQPSTGALESGCNIAIRSLSSSTALVTPSEWLFTENLTDETRLFLEYFYSHVFEKKASQSLTTSTPSTAPESRATGSAESDTQNEEHSIVESRQSASTPAQPAATVPSRSTSSRWSKHNRLQDLSEVAELFRKAMSSKHWKDIKHLFKSTALMKIGDTGGQPEFMDMLPALTIGPALYLLFCKLTDDLQSSYTVSYLSQSGESTDPVKSTYTVQEVLHTALACISCLQSSSASQVSKESVSSDIDELIASCNKSIAYILGTHKDLVSEQQLAEFDENLQHCIRCTDFFKEDLVQFASNDRMVLPIDNMHGGKGEIVQVRKFLEEAMKQHFKKLSIPASWLVLSLCLRKREERTTSLESVLQLAGQLGISREEAKVALWFLHHYAGVLMYFPNLPELVNTVICDNQVVYDSATNLIVNTFKFGSVSKAAAERFQKTGQFSLEDIRQATATLSGDFIPLKKLVKLLSHLNIIAIIASSPNSKTIFFMPCVLQNVTREELEKCWQAMASGQDAPPSPATLFIRYKCGFTPIGVFPAMMANMAGNQSLHLIIKDIKKNRVQFRIGSDFDTITLISQPKHYAIHIARLPTVKVPTCKVCTTVRSLVESTLKTVTSNMNYSFCAEYQLAFECPSHPGREHLCVVDSNDMSPHYMCCLSDVDCPEPLPMQSQHSIWFEQATSRLTEQDFAWICEKLGPYSHNWRQIAQGLRFTDDELCNIEASPLLLTGAPYSYLRGMLSSWLHWAPGDGRGSRGYATLESLRRAVSAAGLGDVAESLITL